LREYVNDDFRCVRRDFEQTVFAAVVICFGFFGLLLLGYDLLSSFDKIRRFRWWNLIRDDYSYYRFEMYIFGWGCALTFWVLTQALPTHVPFWEAVFNSVALHFLLVFTTLFSLGVTIFLDLYGRVIRSYNITLEDILENPECRFFFYHYSKNVFCGEYNLCLEEISLFKKEVNFDEKLRICNRIFDLYLKGFRSELEIRIDKLAYRVVVANIKNSNMDNATFDGVEKNIKLYLNKVLKGFILTRRWHKLFKKYFEKECVTITPVLEPVPVTIQ
jgi:hypothetical protein